MKDWLFPQNMMKNHFYVYIYIYKRYPRGLLQFITKKKKKKQNGFSFTILISHSWTTYGHNPFSYYLLRRSTIGLAKTAPIPVGAWPIIGHLPLLRGTQPPHITLGAMADKYGLIFTIKLGLHPALVLTSWEMAKECLTTNNLALTSRPKLVAAKHLGYNYAMAAFSPYGPYWRELRKINTIELLSNCQLEQLSYVWVSKVETSSKELYKLWTLKNNESGQIIIIIIIIRGQNGQIPFSRKQSRVSPFFLY